MISQKYIDHGRKLAQDHRLFWIGALVIIGLLIGLPHLNVSSEMLLFIDIIIFSILAMGYNVLHGYTGIISFGHAMFFGIPAYITAVLLLEVTTIFSVVIGVAVASGVIVAYIVGKLSFHRGGIYFAMLTLAFAQLVYVLVLKFTDVTGGFDGLTGIPFVELLGSYEVVGIQDQYYLVLAMAVLSFLSIRQIIRSPFGQTLIAVRENEQRAQAAGYNVRKIKILSLCISAGYSAIAGSLFVLTRGFVSPQSLHFTLSADVIFMALLGGLGTLTGPIIGGFLLIVARDILSGIWDRWPVLLGIMFIILPIYARQGIVGLFRDAKYMMETRLE